MSNGVRYTPTFAMPSEYERQAMEARRRRRMAEMLAAQAYQPQEGGVAPIPSAAPLVQGLQAFLTARQLKKAEEAEEKAQKADIESVAELQRSLGPQERVAAPDMFVSPDEMASKYTAPRMETYTPSAEERQALLDRAFVSGSPRTQRLAELMMAREKAETPKSPYSNVDMSKLTESSRKAFAASVAAGKPDYTLLESREFSELTPQQLVEAMFKMGQYGIDASKLAYETGQTAPPLRMPFSPQSTAPQFGPPQAGTNVPPQAPRMPPTQLGTVPTATPPVAQPVAAVAPRTETAPPTRPLVETLPKQKSDQLLIEKPKAGRAAADGLARLNMLKNYLTELKNNPGSEKIFGLVGQIPVDLQADARSAANAFRLFREGSSVQAIQQARESSATGGAFGSVTEQEWPRFETIFGAIDRSLDWEDAKPAINNAIREIDQSIAKYENEWAATYGGKPPYTAPKYEFQYERFKKPASSTGIKVERLPVR